GRITRGESIIGPNLAKPQKLAKSTQGDSPTGLEHAPKVRFSYFTTRFASIPPRVRRGLAASTVKTSQFGGYANSPGAQRAIWCTIVCMTERFFAGFCLRTTYLAKKSPFARFGPIMAATDCHQRNYVERDSRCINLRVLKPLLTVEPTLGLRSLDAGGARASKARRYLPSRLKAYSLLLLVPPGPRA